MRLHSRFVMAMALTGAGLFCASAAQATTDVFSTINAVGGFNRGGGAWCVDGPSGACDGSMSLLIAQPFQSSTSGTLDHLDLAIANLGPTIGALADGVAVALVRDNGKGTAPDGNDPALEEWVITKLKYTSAQNATMKATKVASKLHPALNAGQTYWIVLSPTGYDGSTAWYYNTLGKTPGLVSGDGGHSWTATNTSTAFDVWKQ